jgi:hypothetical protein
MANILTAVKEGIHSYWEKVYSRSSFNQMWILKYWIFWIIVIIVLYQKFRLSKHVTFVHFTDHSSWECIKTFQKIIKNPKLIVIHISKYCVIFSCSNKNVFIFCTATNLSNSYSNDRLTVKLSGFQDMKWRDLFTSTRR